MTSRTIINWRGLQKIPEDIIKLSILCLVDLTSTIVNFPPGLQILICKGIQLTKLPESLPATLQTLDCSYNQLTQLPDCLPRALLMLNCSSNYLTRLPETLPATLRELNCYDNQLTSLPNELPLTLQILVCGSNKLTSLPNSLMPALRDLDCHHNAITWLPDKLPPLIKELNCSENQITALPIYLPLSLRKLDISNNPLPGHLMTKNTQEMIQYNQVRRMSIGVILTLVLCKLYPRFSGSMSLKILQKLPYDMLKLILREMVSNVQLTNIGEVRCECGVVIKKSSMAGHLKTNKHIARMNSLYKIWCNV